MNQPEPGQVWEYTDTRTGWSYAIVLVERRAVGCQLTENFNAFVLDWDTSFALDRNRLQVVGMWELNVYFKLIT